MKILTKNMFAALFCVACATPVFAQDVAINETNFPDPVFRDYLVRTFSTYAADGVFTQDEIANIKKIEPYPTDNGDYVHTIDSPIKSVKGIEFFTAVEKITLFDNELTDLDVSKNLALKELNISGNNNGKQIIKNVDLSKNTNLTDFWAHGSGIETVTLPESPLKTLSLIANNIQKLDIPEASRKTLEILSTSTNPMVALDLKGCTITTGINRNCGRTINVDFYYEEDGNTYYYIDLLPGQQVEGDGYDLTAKLPNSGFDLNKVVSGSWTNAEVVTSPYSGKQVLRLKGKPEKITYKYVTDANDNGMSFLTGLPNYEFYLKLTYNDVHTGVEDVNTNCTRVCGTKGAIKIESDNDAAVQVYSIDGRKVYGGTDKVISMNQGIYLVTVNNKTQKVVVK